MSASKIISSSLVRAIKFSLIMAVACTAVQAQNANTPNTGKPPSPATDTVLARSAAGVSVSVQDVLSELQRAPDASRNALMSRPESLQQIVNNILVRRTLAVEGERNGVTNDAMVAATLALTRDRVLAEARLAQLDILNTPNKNILDQNAAEMYKANSARFDKPAQTRARHILLDSKATDALQKAQELLANLRAGASFEALAQEKSMDVGSAAKGGDLGFFPAGKMVQPFDDAVKTLAKPGDLSEPVLSQFGYHIIRLEERQEKSRQPLDEVREQLINEIKTTVRGEARTQKIQKLSTDFVFEKQAIEALAKSVPR